MLSNVFFGISGLTSTSASYLCNLAQEQVKGLEEWLSSIRFYSENKTVSHSGVEYLTRNCNVRDLDTIKEILKNQIANFYWFIAYVKEAIKAKNAADSALPDFGVWAQGKLPEQPQSPDYVHEEDVIAEFDASKLAKYLRLQQYASVFGKMIHERGPIANARKVANKLANDPIVVDKLENDIIITRYNLQFTLDDIDAMYNELQAQRREYDKQLNQIKFEILDEVKKRNKELDLKYQTEYEQWRSLRDKLRSEYSVWYRDTREEISLWKIVIPEELQPTLKYLQSLGKADK